MTDLGACREFKGVFGVVQPVGEDACPRLQARFPVLYEKHFGFVLGVVRALGVTPRDQEDVVQEVWVKAYRKIDRLRADASERAWLASFARRAVQHYRRRVGRSARKIQAVSEQWDDVTNPHLRFEKQQLADAVLAQLSTDQRLAYVLVHGYGMSGAEAALAIGASVNTIYSRLRLAQKNLERLSEVSGISCETLPSHARPEPSEERRARAEVLALVMVRVGGTKPAVLGTWFAAAAAAMLLVGIGMLATGSKGEGSSGPGARSVHEPALLASAPDNAEVGLLASSIASQAMDDKQVRYGAGGQVRERLAAPATRSEAGLDVSLGTRSDLGTDEAARRDVNAPVHTPTVPKPTPEPQTKRAPKSAPEPDAKPALKSDATHQPQPQPQRPSEGELPTAAAPIAEDSEIDGHLAALASDVEAASGRQRAIWGAAESSTPPARQASLLPETQLLRQAKAAHNAGRTKDTIRLLDEYDTSFPSGRMRDVADSIRISTLCKRGRARQAEKYAAALEERSPSSPINAKVRNACW